jgi:hypothetical protein
MKQFYVARRDFCYTVNQNDKQGLHVVAGPFVTIEDANSTALSLATSLKDKHLVFELVGGYDLVPAEIKKIM